MEIQGKVAFVTGANRGLGREFVKALLAGGAAKVYAAARDVTRIDIPGAQAIALDVTSADSIAAAVAQCGDVDLLINNAGIMSLGSLLDSNSADSLRHHMETNLFGPLALSQAFAPILKAQGGGAIINILSVLSWIAIQGSGPYSISKAAAWSLTNGLRNELRSKQTQVVGVHPAYIDTDMASASKAPKTKPEDVVRSVLEGLAQGLEEILVDDTGRSVKKTLSTPEAYYLMTSRQAA